MSQFAESINQLYAESLEEREIAFVYFDYSAVIVRSRYGSFAIDLGDEFESDAISEIKSLDFLLITHSHSDHFSKKNIMKIVECTDALVIVEPQVVDELERAISKNRLVIGDSGKTRRKLFKFDDTEITAIMGVHPRPITVFKIDWRELSIFHGGDSGYMAIGSQKVDVAFLPVESPSPTCSPEVALAMVKWLNPKVVIPMQGKEKQMVEFQKLIEEKKPKTKVVIPKQFEVMKISL